MVPGTYGTEDCFAYSFQLITICLSVFCETLLFEKDLKGPINKLIVRAEYRYLVLQYHTEDSSTIPVHTRFIL